MNYQQLNVEVGPIFRRSLKFRPAAVAARVGFDSSNPIAAGERAEGKSNATDFEQADYRVTSAVF